MPLSLLMLSSQKDLHDKQPLHYNIYYQISKEKISKKFRFYAICVNLFEGCYMCVCQWGGGALSTILLQIYTFFMEKNAPKLYSVHNKFFLHLNRCFQYSQQFSSFILNIFLCLTRTIISVNNGGAIKIYCH